MAVAFELTGTVATVKVPVVAPAAIVAVVGIADAVLDETVTVRPPVGAALLIVIEPLDETPPTTAVGLKDNAVTVGPLTVSVAVCTELPAVAVIVTVAVVPTATVVAVNVPVF